MVANDERRGPGQPGYMHNGYKVVERIVDRKRKKIKVHRLVMEEFLGRKLQPWEVVHHKDGDKLNNHLENLELVSPEMHVAHHKGGHALPRKEALRAWNAISTEQEEKIYALRKKGHSYVAIARRVGVCDFTVRKYVLRRTA